MKTITAIADRLVGLLKEKQFVAAYRELFSDDAESIDPIYKDEPPLKGLGLLIEREEQFLSRADVGEISISAPLLAGNYFAVNLTMAFVAAGQDRKVEELCVYEVADGKIIRQQFFIAG